MPLIGLVIGLVLGAIVGAAYFVALTTLLSLPGTFAAVPQALVQAASSWWALLLGLGQILSLAGALLVHLILVALAYGVAALVTPTATGTRVAMPPNPLEEIALGGLMGLNAAVNACILFALVPALLLFVVPVTVVAPPLGLALAIIVMLLPWYAGVLIAAAAVRTTFATTGLSNAPWYHAVLGCSAMVQVFPMMWPGNLLGALQLALEILLSLANWRLRIHPELRTGTIAVHGGPVTDFFASALGAQGYSLGTFCFVPTSFGWRDPRLAPGSARPQRVTALGIIAHESGHTLSLALFGNLYGVMNFIDQSVLGRGADAYAEVLAEGMVRENGRRWHGMLTPVPPAPASNVPPAETAAAPPDRLSATAVLLGEGVTLDGSGVTDPDGGPLTLLDPGTAPLGRLWYASDGPLGSFPIARGAASTTFTPPATGSYTLRYAVTDGVDGPDDDGDGVDEDVRMTSAASGDPQRFEVLVAVRIVPGQDYETEVDVPVTLDGSATDAGADFRLPSQPAATGSREMDVLWSVVDAQTDDGSPPATSFTPPDGDVTDFEADTAGTYTLGLAVRPRSADPWLEALTTVRVNEAP